jgi:hypothetical protein
LRIITNRIEKPKIERAQRAGSTRRTLLLASASQ